MKNCVKHSIDTSGAKDEHQAMKAFCGFSEADFDSEKINNYSYVNIS
jgi:hypothetical protein